jgi:hypothetical protein
VRLLAAQRSVTASRFGKQVFLDPGIYVASIGAQFRINVWRRNYASPVHAQQIIPLPGGGAAVRNLPGWTVHGYHGLRDFLRMVIRNKSGKIVFSRLLTFCPGGYAPERTGPASAHADNFPEVCGAYDPFPIGQVWGIAKGWAVDPAQSGFGYINARLRLGTYHLTENIVSNYDRIFKIPARDQRTSVTLHVVKGSGCCIGPVGRGNDGRRTAASQPLPSLPEVPLLRQAPASALPDLVPLPSWGISTSHVKKTSQDFLNFGATVWVGGSSPLDVEGFRKAGSPTMLAYQYYWHDGRIVGRTRAGTMGFDNKKGHHHWHFEQFARYVLLKANKKVAVRSEKVGFCIAPTDAVDMLSPHASWNPSSIGLSGQCGSPTALWVQEYMPIGWGDTYNQSKAGQAFNITHLRNGTYYIEIIANPEHLLHEVTRANDVSLRKVIIGGTPGHRTVTVPAYHGIDPERFPRK